MVEILPASAGDTRDLGSIPGSGRSPGVGNGKTHSSILAWRIPWTEEPGELQSTGCHKESDTTEQLTFCVCDSSQASFGKTGFLL